MRFKSSLCFTAAIASFLAFAPAMSAQTISESLEAAEAIAQETEENTAESEMEKWSDVPEIKSGFMQGCIGEIEQLTEQQANIKTNYCQCAFEAYSSRYTPQQFLQINSFSSQIGESGITLVNLMMAPELNNCADSTEFQF